MYLWCDITGSEPRPSCCENQINFIIITPRHKLTLKADYDRNYERNYE